MATLNRFRARLSQPLFKKGVSILIRNLLAAVVLSICVLTPWQNAFARHRVVVAPVYSGVQVPSHVETYVAAHPGTYIPARPLAYVPVITPRAPYYNDYAYPFYPQTYYFVWDRHHHHHDHDRVDIIFRANSNYQY